jgi:hypothetical protein
MTNTLASGPAVWPYTTSLVDYGHPVNHPIYLRLSSASNCRFASSRGSGA